MNNVLIGGDGWVYYETIGGGQGGRPGPPGMNGVHTAMTNTKNTPIEAFERAFPMRVLRYRLRRGSGGAGSPGGEGIERDLEMLEDVTVSLITERRVSQPWGLAGGEPGAVGENWLLPGGDESRAERLLDKCTIQTARGRRAAHAHARRRRLVCRQSGGNPRPGPRARVWGPCTSPHLPPTSRGSPDRVESSSRARRRCRAVPRSTRRDTS